MNPHNPPDFSTIPGIIRRAVRPGLNQMLSAPRLEFVPFLLSSTSDAFLEPVARRAHYRTLYKFGKTVQLYAPAYLSNECTNACAYCGFNVQTDIRRKTLSFGEMENEFRTVAQTGIRHILLVTGEAPQKVNMDYLVRAVEIARRFFPSVNLEIYPLSIPDYRSLIRAGADGLTLYQETYHAPTYRKLHKGTKADYSERLDAVERAATAGFRRIGIGALLGLYDPCFEMIALLMHLEHLRKKYWKTLFSVSFPRMRQAEQGIPPAFDVSDRLLVKMILTLRLFFDDVGIVVSTREKSRFRDNLIGLGVTQMSAGSRTEPGGYMHPNTELKQFEIEDIRSPAEVAAAIAQRGFEPVWKDWDRGFEG